MTRPSRPLVIIPNYMTEPGDVAVVGACLKSIRQTVSDTVDILVVDDASPYTDGLAELQEVYGRTKFILHTRDENGGFSETVNVGLRRALEDGREAILMNADMEMTTPGWLKRCRDTTDAAGRPAALVGALLVFPNGLIQHGGVYLSLLTRDFNHTFKYAPSNLAEALHKRACPVTGAFHYIRHETLEAVGLYDERFRLGWEDMDYCFRVINEGLQCVFNPNIRALHHESFFRARPSKKAEMWTAKSFQSLVHKYAEQSFAGLVPNWDG